MRLHTNPRVLFERRWCRSLNSSIRLDCLAKDSGFDRNMDAVHDKDEICRLFCELQQAILKAVLVERERCRQGDLAVISGETAADTIYAIDRIAERTIIEWFEQVWPANRPIEIVMEGLGEGEVMTFPRGTPADGTELKCILDPIDGTRGIMYDKRPAWILAGVALQRGSANRLTDIEIAVMTELPTTRQWRADQVFAIRGEGVQAVALDVRGGFAETPVQLAPSQAVDVCHAFGTVSRFFPAGLTALSRFEEALWESLYGQAETAAASPLVFNDQYISTGGQFYEILQGHDRFIADLRPEAFRKLGIKSSLSCHPYDVATALILEEAGCVLEKPEGGRLDCPLDTTSPVSWVAYANLSLADAMRPIIRELIQRHFY